MTIASQLDALDALLGAATPGPWVNPDGYCVRHEQREPWQPVCTKWGSNKAENIERQVANMEVIATLRNAASELVAVARAALDLDGHTEICTTMQPYRGCSCGYEALEKALAALASVLPT